MQNASNEKRSQLITYKEFPCEVLQTIGTFLEGKTPRDVRIQHKDDEDTLVSLKCDEDLIDACRCLRPVDNSKDLYRLSGFSWDISSTRFCFQHLFNSPL